MSFFTVSGEWKKYSNKRFRVNDGNGNIITKKLTFKEWVEFLCLWGDYDFLLDGYQTGELFYFHEYYQRGISPDEATKIDYDEFARV